MSAGLSEVEYGLELQSEFVSCQGLEYVALQAQAFSHALRHAVVAQHETAFVRSLNRFFQSLSRGKRGNTDAGVDDQGFFTASQRTTQRGENAPGNLLSVFLGRQVIEQHHELITSETCEVVAFSHADLEALCHFYQDTVSCGMTQTVVDELETIQIEEQQGSMSGRRSRKPLKR